MELKWSKFKVLWSELCTGDIVIYEETIYAMWKRRRFTEVTRIMYWGGNYTPEDYLRRVLYARIAEEMMQINREPALGSIPWEFCSGETIPGIYLGEDYPGSYILGGGICAETWWRRITPESGGLPNQNSQKQCREISEGSQTVFYHYTRKTT